MIKSTWARIMTRMFLVIMAEFGFTVPHSSIGIGALAEPVRSHSGTGISLPSGGPIQPEVPKGTRAFACAGPTWECGSVGVASSFRAFVQRGR